MSTAPKLAASEPNRYHPLPGEGLRSIVKSTIAHANRPENRDLGNPAYVEVDYVTITCKPGPADDKTVDDLLLKYLSEQELNRRIAAALEDFSTSDYETLDAKKVIETRVKTAGTEKRLMHVAAELADRWAGCLEAKLKSGWEMDDMAAECYHEANVHRIESLWVYNAAVQTIAGVWNHSALPDFMAWQERQDREPKAHHEASGLYTQYRPAEILSRWG